MFFSGTQTNMPATLTNKTTYHPTSCTTIYITQDSKKKKKEAISKTKFRNLRTNQMKQHEESGRQLVCLKAEALHAFFNSWTIFFETQIINCLFLFYSDHNLCFRFFKKPNKRICERLSFWASNKISNFGHAEEAREQASPLTTNQFPVAPTCIGLGYSVSLTVVCLGCVWLWFEKTILISFLK